MTDFECRTCGPKWNGCYNLDGRCVTCGEPVKAKERWREESESEEVENG